MPEYIQAQKEKRTFKDIVLDQLNKILQLSCDEFRGGYTQRQIKGNWTEEVYVPDARKRISQAIEFFSFLLQPIYDEEMEKKSKEIKKKIEENLKKFNKKEIDRDTFRVNKLSYMKELFEELNFLLSRKVYLKGQTMTDTRFEEDEYDSEGEEDSKDD